MVEFLGLFNYGAALFLILIGIFAMIVYQNLVRKIIAMTLLQTGVILFYVTLAFKWDSLIPILPHTDHHMPINVDLYANPLPHALMLTAIVVGVSTLGVALVLTISVFRQYQTLEEDEIIDALRLESAETPRRRSTTGASS